MSRPLRLEFSGALYHITSRGNERKAIYQDEHDFHLFLQILGDVCEHYNWLIHAYCLMTNHYHLLLETPDANLSKGMRQLNGVFTQAINKKHHRVGHLFQGRYKSILVDSDNYLLELNRYIVLNPVRAHMVAHPNEWPWSSYGYTIGPEEPPNWLAVDALLLQFSKQRKTALRKYQVFVLHENVQCPWDELKHQVFLGDEQFVEKHQQLITEQQGDLAEIPAKQQRLTVKPLSYYQAKYPEDNKAAMAAAYASGGYTLAEIAKAFGVHYSTVSRACSAQKAKGKT